MTDYTKGEWEVFTGVAAPAVIISGQPDKLICHVRLLLGSESMAEAEANARLIAASPLLYEALKSVTGYLSEQKARRHKNSWADQRAGSDAEDLLPIVEKALAKAEGK